MSENREQWAAGLVLLWLLQVQRLVLVISGVPLHHGEIWRSGFCPCLSCGSRFIGMSVMLAEFVIGQQCSV